MFCNLQGMYKTIRRTCRRTLKTNRQCLGDRCALEEGMYTGTLQEPITEKQVKRVGMIFWIGFATYVVSFFLPAVQVDQTSPIRGWTCAWISLAMAKEAYQMPLPFLSGLVNLMVIALVLSRKRMVGYAAVALLPASWIFFAMANIRVLPGHIAWVGGILMMVWHDPITRFLERSAR